MTFTVALIVFCIVLIIFVIYSQIQLTIDNPVRHLFTGESDRVLPETTDEIDPPPGWKLSDGFLVPSDNAKSHGYANDISNQSLGGGESSNRTFNTYSKDSVDIAGFDFQTAMAKAAKAYASDGVVANFGSVTSEGTSRGSNNNAGGLDNIQDTVQTVAPGVIIEDKPTPIGVERDDHRCGPSVGGAKCGFGRCCSIFGWCGDASHCKPGINDPNHNGPNVLL